MFSSAVFRSNCTASAMSILLMITRSAFRKMVGYFSGLSSPSVTDSRTTRLSSPRSKDAGQTRLPTFSMKRILSPSRFSLSSACSTMCASRWQAVPVEIWTAGAPFARTRFASFSVWRSPTITPIFNVPPRSASVRSMRAVLPEPGEDRRLTTRSFLALKKPRLRSARSWFRERIDCWTSISFVG